MQRDKKNFKKTHKQIEKITFQQFQNTCTAFRKYSAFLHYSKMLQKYHNTDKHCKYYNITEKRYRYRKRLALQFVTR